VDSYFDEVRDLLDRVLQAEATSHEAPRASESAQPGIRRKLDLLTDLVTVEREAEDERLAAWVGRAIHV
jgi:hypothetical protein